MTQKKLKSLVDKEIFVIRNLGEIREDESFVSMIEEAKLLEVKKISTVVKVGNIEYKNSRFESVRDNERFTADFFMFSTYEKARKYAERLDALAMIARVDWEKIPRKTLKIVCDIIRLEVN